ncbi:D-glucuronyl C5-epimerase family protein [Catenovulum sp. 2E275]|uniref:D-glucuronyl C5-epimerase family protein n=1 Tax=Catenovulum sp. 2E275 TaxID=2980497 RepID=UPI0021D31CD2|nr:D-glucuronyl C5-epimerase family protein [Catenovulum sp. 2E275]MCU4674742.1 D-glucuronyl C5-epimerase family protein [Catenovulum sp. 2E275]
MNPVTEIVKTLKQHSPLSAVSKNKWLDKSEGCTRYVEKYINTYPPFTFVDLYSAFGFYSLMHPDKDYFVYVQNPRIKVEADGRIFLNYKDRNGQSYLAENPVITAQAALCAFNQTKLATSNDKHQTDQLAIFYQLADQLCHVQTLDGKLPYLFDWFYYIKNDYLTSGWCSGMAQGQAISVWVRGVKSSGEKKYLDSALAAFHFMLKPVIEGGVLADLSSVSPALKHLNFVEEYPLTKSAVTLNGWMYALLGVYDLLQLLNLPEFNHLRERQIAEDFLAEQVDLLCNLLPLFDIDGLSSYDLGYLIFQLPPNFDLGYHQTHIVQLRILANLLKQHQLLEWSEHWLNFYSVHSANTPGWPYQTRFVATGLQ